VRSRLQSRLAVVCAALWLGGCQGPGEDLVDDRDDSFVPAGKYDGAIPPSGSYCASPSVTGRLSLLLLTDTGAFHRELTTTCQDGSCASTGDDGTFTLSSIGSINYVRFLRPDGSVIDRYAWKVSGQTLSLRKTYTSTWQTLTACAPAHCDARDPRLVPIALSVFPDAGEAPVVDLVKQAKSSIRVMVYQLTKGGVLDALAQKARDGRSVKVILDQSQQPADQAAFTALQSAGAQVIWSDPAFTFMHAKVTIVDDSEAMISTGNYSLAQMTGERNYSARDTDPDDVASLRAIFDADFQRQTPDLSCTRLVVSPVNSHDRILALIDRAKTSLLIESMQFADTTVRAHVLARKQAGVDVRAILADPSWIAANRDAASFLGSNNIPARYITSPKVHVKSIIVDGTLAYLGSENLSQTSLTKNREVGLIVSESAAVKTMTQTFEHDWLMATGF
jgi:cardiolipin synthase A/B